MNLLAAASLEPSDLTRRMVALAVLLGLSRVLGEVSRRLKQPRVLGYISPGGMQRMFPATESET